MQNHLGKIAVIGMVLAGGYYIFNSGEVSGYTIPFLSVSKNDTAQAGSQAISNIQTAAKETLLASAGQLTDTIAKKVDSAAKDAMTAVKTEAFNLVKGAVEKNVDNLAAGLGINTSQSGSSDPVVSNPDPISLSVKSGSPVYFTVKNSEQASINYVIDWMDGTNETGQIAKSGSRTVSHSWSNAGEYLLQFKIRSLSGSNDYKVRISIL